MVSGKQLVIIQTPMLRLRPDRPSRQVKFFNEVAWKNPEGSGMKGTHYARP